MNPLSIIAVICFTATSLWAEELISGQALDNFESTRAWHLVDRVGLNDGDVSKIESSPNARGKILLNADTRVKRLPYLLTKQRYDDVDVTLEFMIPKDSNAGIYLMGRYEVQILDSYGKEELTFSDIGGIYEEWARKGVDIGDRPLYAGSAPLVNAAKAPGEWQRLDIRFRAPRFNSAGEKIENARFIFVYLNGELVQKDVPVTAPTVSNPVKGESTSGPIAIQGDHGAIAIRSFIVKPAPLSARRP